MRKFLTVILALAACAAGEAWAAPKVILVLHGGAADKADLQKGLSRAMRKDFERALEAGYAVWKEGASSVDMVEAAIKVLEDSPRFNAGKGAVFTLDGRNELDASIMDGRTLNAGAVTGVTIVKNPISAARAVMERSPHVLLAGRGAEVFATQAGLEIVDQSYFWTQPRWAEIKEMWEKKLAFPPKKTRLPEEPRKWKWGTVGAVALDKEGRLAAGTSTGGLTGKAFGRVGDSPLIGAGTYADDRGCAVSATGHGEYFIRYGVAHDVVALVKYKDLSVEQAAKEVIHDRLLPAGGEGGVIVLDPKGRHAAVYNTAAMYRAYIRENGKATVELE